MYKNIFFLNIIFGYSSLKKLKSIILKFKIELKNTVNRDLNNTDNIDILDILNTKLKNLNKNKV